MPFVAERDGELVTPEEVADDAICYCRECGDKMLVKNSYVSGGSFVARHFYHKNGAGGCSGGESEVHERLKSIVLSKVKNVFDYADAGVEKRIARNVADVYAVLEERDEKYGQGIVCEVQYRHDAKDIDAATENYLREGYSVCWIEGADIEGKDVDLAEPEWHYAGEFEDTASSETSTEFGMRWPHEDVLTCESCVTEPELVENRQLKYAYGDKPIYECPQCGSYYKLERGTRGDKRAEQIPLAHEGNISRRSSPRRDW